MENLLRWQFHLVWSLLEEHFATLTEDDVHWEPVSGMLKVREGDDGRWRPDWIEPEPPDGPPATIGWLTWHIGWWWTEALAAWHGEPLLPREEIYWPGSADAAVAWIRDLASRWRQVLADLPGPDLDRMAPFPWHDRADRTIGHMVYWVNGELMKNAAELGQLRMAHTTAQRTRDASASPSS